MTSAGLTMVACAPAADPLDYADPTAPTGPTTVNGITAYVATPAVSGHQFLPITVEASSEAGPVTAEIVVAETIRPMKRRDDGRFVAYVGLAAGDNRVEIRIATADGVHYRSVVRTIRYALDGLQIERVTADQGGACGDRALANPTNAGAVCVETTREATLTRDGVPVTGALVQLRPGPNTIVAQAPGGARDVLVLTLDDVGPTVTVEPIAPSSAAQVVLRGTVEDDGGVAALQIAGGSGTVDDVPITSPFEIPVSLQPGLNTVVVIATDTAGNATSVPVTLRRARTFELAEPTPSGTVLTLSLDRDALAELVPEADQRALTLANVDLRPAMVNAFNAVKEPEVYGVDTSKWTQRQWNSHAILNITPDNLDPSGTLMEPLLNVAQAVGVPPARILAETFGIAPTDSILAGSQIVDALIDNVVGSHPNAQFDEETGRPIFVLSLYDVLRDLETLGERLGPVGDHPGLVGGGGTHGDLLEPGFAMNVTATSQFTRYDGVDASRDAKDFLFLLPPDTPAVTFDFEDPSTFTVVGMKDEPTIDFQFQVYGILEHIAPGTEQYANPAPPPFAEGFYFGSSEAWSIPRYFDERVITESAFRIYHEQFADTGYEYTHVYDAGNIDEVATVHWDRGWLTITTKGDLGSPPPPAYIWDLVLDVVQERALDGGIAPFGGSLLFDMAAIPVGLDADQLIAQLRPTLQEQAVEMSDVLVGREQIAASGADFVFQPGFLVFRSPDDSAAPYGYANPGFFADAALTERVSEIADGHHRAPTTPGATYYFEDDEAVVYRVDVIDAGTIDLLPTTEAP